MTREELREALDERWRLFRDEAVRYAHDPARIATVFDDHRRLIEQAVIAAGEGEHVARDPRVRGRRRKGLA